MRGDTGLSILSVRSEDIPILTQRQFGSKTTRIFPWNNLRLVAMMLGPSYPNNDVALLAAAAGACHHSGEGGENIHGDRAVEKNAYGNGIKSNKKVLGYADSLREDLDYSSNDSQIIL